MQHNIAIFASGRGSNALKIIEHFQNHPNICVKLIVSNRKNAPVLDYADTFKLKKHTINRSSFYDSKEIVDVFSKYDINFIVLAGFLWLIPSYLVRQFPDKIVNIHPALLPNFGGKGMYGMNVHQAVYEAKEAVSGITIHYVNEKYDEGNVILQAQCRISASDTPTDIAKKVLHLEHQYFATSIESILSKKP